MTSPAALEAQQLLAARHRVGGRVFEFSDDLLGSASHDGYFTALNPAWERTLGFSRQALMGQPFLGFVHPGDREATVAEMARLASEGVGPTRFENRYPVAGGGWRWLSWQVEVADEGYYFVAHDVTLRVADSQRRLLRDSIIAGIDDAILTKTTDGVVTSWNPASEELYGYTAREAIGNPLVDLIVPEELRAEPGRIVGRLLAGEGIRQYTTKRRRKDGAALTVSLTASLMRDSEHEIVGVAIVSRNIAGLDSDQDTEVHAELDTLAWVGRIRDAVDENRIVFHAQPIISLRGTPTSYELLCRMIDREGTTVPPGRFLPAAENYGQIAELDLLAIDEGARQIASGHRVNINFSTVSVGRRHIVDILAEKLHAAQADPSKLTIEITETALMKDMIRAQRFAEGASALGCRIALDDFGTGFGGFTYLKKLHLDQLKIDVEFVRDLKSSRASQQVVKAVVSLAEGLGLETVAEGVEDEEALTLLTHYGVTHAQGYFLASPGPIAEIIGDSNTPARPESAVTA